MTKALLLAPILLLSGCWSGSEFYSASDSVQAIPSGTYRVMDERGPPASMSDSDFGKQVKISYRANGHAVVESSESGEVNDAIIVKLGSEKGLYAVQSDLGTAIPSVGSSLYALVRVFDGGYQITVPRCDQKRIPGFAQAVTSGLFVGKTICRFNDRADLELALLSYAKDPISWTEYGWVGKRARLR